MCVIQNHGTFRAEVRLSAGHNVGIELVVRTVEGRIQRDVGAEGTVALGCGLCHDGAAVVDGDAAASESGASDIDLWRMGSSGHVKGDAYHFNGSRPQRLQELLPAQNVLHHSRYGLLA